MDDSDIMKIVKSKLNSIICECCFDLREENNKYERKRLKSLMEQAKLLLYIINNASRIYGGDFKL